MTECHNVMKLSPRLTQLIDMVEHHYDHIWDCCCDHGFLGEALLEHQAHSTIHFVDIVPELIEQLEQRLLTSTYMPQRWNTHCLDVSRLPLDQHSGKHLVIIAGVGGELTAEFIQTLQAKFAHLAVDFLLCPVHHHFTLRQALIKQNMHCIDEVLVEDNRRFYELLLVSSDKTTFDQVTPVGAKLWQSVCPVHSQVIERYWHKTMRHYQRIAQGSPEKAGPILEAYQSVKPF